jgi:predicted Rossmann-fold nucleotide-binding protein
MKIEFPREVKRQGHFVIVVYGGRDFTDENVIFDALDQALMQCEDQGNHLTVVQGGASGADRIAKSWAEYQDGAVTNITENADWKIHGRAAGPRRNQLMIDKYMPDFFISVPGGKGTADMAERCKTAGIPGVKLT